MARPGILACLVAAITVVAAGVSLPGVARADAGEGCRAGHGVTVVVDFHQLDHRDVRACLPDGGGQDAARLLREAGLTLTDVQRQPGFVCRVAGLPSDDPCVNTPPAAAYWSLWWSDGSAGRWTYSTVMAASLEVPDGGLVGLVWDQSAGELQPAVAPGSPEASAAPEPGRPHGATQEAAAPAEDPGHGLPWWVAPVALVVLLGVAAGAAAGRRRQRGRP